MKLHSWFTRAALCVAALIGAVSAGATGGELLRTEAGEWMSAGKGGDVRTEGGEVTLAVSGAGQAPAVRQEADLPDPAPAAVRLSGEVKLAGVVRGARTWHSGRMLVTYLDAQGQVLGETYTLDRLEGTSEWRAVRRQFPVPAGARRVRVELQLLEPGAGSIAFRGVSLQALDEAEAQAWRVEAEARIRENRMAPLRVRVEDEQGKAVPDADVAVFMRRHAYPFGTAAQAKLLIAPKGDAQTDTYRSVVENFFNYVTLENDLKGRLVESKGLDTALAALAWLQERGMAMRGHVLTWPSLAMSTKAENAAKDDPAALREVMHRSFLARLEATEPYGIADWDVLNEPTVHNDLIRILGDDQVAEWFRWAKEAAPKSRLYLNENNVEFAGGNREGLEQWIRRLKAAGAPLEGLGWQGHMWHRTLPAGQNILDDLDHFAPYGLPVQITEYDTHERFGEADEARFLDEFLPAWFSHPLTSGFIMWGFQDAYMWNGNGPLFRKDWSLKPSGKVWMEYVFGRWWTEVRGRTGIDGAYGTLGFLGDYEIEAVQGNRRATGVLRLPAGGADLVLRLKADDGTARLVSTNPYSGGRLPAIIVPEAKKSEELETRVLRTQDGKGALGFSPPGEGRVLRGAETAAARVDVYARFDAAVLSKHVEDARLRVRLASVPEKAARMRFYVLSNRFVPQGAEAGSDWTAADLGPDRAPGRDAGTGDYRLGDAAVIYLGEASCAEADGNGWLAFSSPELTRAVAQSRASGVTVMVATTAARLELETVELELRVKKTTTQ
jgi:endo-1,4-beta-xylanase